MTRLLQAGSEENTVATCLWQARAGHEVTLVHGQDFDPRWYDTPPSGVTLKLVPELIHPISVRDDLRALNALRKLYRDLGPDVIHTHQSKAGVLGRLAASAVPTAQVVHGIHIVPFNGVGWLRRTIFIAAERAAARRTDLFIAVSRNAAHQYIEAGICTEHKARCVYSGMQLEPFIKSDPPADWRSLVGQNESTPVVLMLAAFEERKRHVSFLEVFQQVIDRAPDARLLLAGAGPQENNIRHAVRDMGLEDRVVFCGHRPDPGALLALADVCVLTSNREGLPRVVVQSLAAGCPVVVTSLPGIEEIVVNGVNGIITDTDDLSETARSVADILSNERLRKWLQDGAAATDVSNWRLELLGERTTAQYKAA
ncbi:MAG: glycosyltransferase [Paracoccaceae bacterium]